MNDVIEVDGVEYKIPQTLEVGTSFFVPGLNLKKIVDTVGKHYKNEEFRLSYMQQVEGDLWGVRIWRAM